jgi:hypothetical protein
MAIEHGRKTVKLNRAGGSRAAVLPAAWLERLGISDAAVLVETDEGILVTPPAQTMPSIEDDPHFAGFLGFLAQDAMLHPEKLGDVGELIKGDDELLKGVDPDAE